ncbi:MAG TPA: transporter [Tepidisphaeraceae bacterium]|nr:transporter [Tepidisphaeraceae bacterium]
MKRAWLVLVGTVLLAGKVQAGRPLVVDDAEPVEYRKSQIEAGVDYIADSETRSFASPVTFTYGVVPRLELAVGSAWLWEHRDEAVDVDENVNGIGNVAVGGKWKIIDQETFLADQGLGFSVILPTASADEGLGTGHVDADLTWLITRKITERLQVDVNLGYTYVGGEDLDDLAHYGVAVAYLLTEQLQPVAEIFGDTPIGDSGQTVFRINGGIRWLVAEGLTLDAAIGTGIRGEAPDVFATMGLTWVF